MSDPIKSIRFRKTIESFCVALVLLTCGAFSAQNEEHRRDLALYIGMISVRDAPLPEFPSSGSFMPLWVIGQIVSGGR